jgi:hypothetical protein
LPRIGGEILDHVILVDFLDACEERGEGGFEGLLFHDVCSL